MKLSIPDFQRHWIATAFFLSGMAALFYQVVWQRVLTQAVGSDSVSITFVVTFFMLWLGIGASLAKILIAKAPADKVLKLYAIIEFCVGVYGAVSILVLRTANAWFATKGIDNVYADLTFNALLLAFPVIGMGMTTPLIIHAVKNSLADLGRTTGLYYGLNILGAAAGAVLAGLVLIELFGLNGTAFLAALINVGIGILFLRKAGAILPASKTAEISGQSPGLRIYLAAIIFGFGTLAIQILFIRILLNYFTMAPVTFPMVLGSYLLLMAAGQWLGGKLADRYADRLNEVIAGLFAAGSALFLGVMWFPPQLAAYLGAMRFTSFNGSLVEHDHQWMLGDAHVLIMFLFSMFIMMAVVPWAALFPVMLRLVTQRIEDAGKKFASLYTLYTVGNVFGALLCGLVFLGKFGTSHSAMIIIAAVGVGALLIVARTKSKHAFLACAIGIAIAGLIPASYYKHFKLGDYHIETVYEGLNGVVSVVPTKRFYTIIDMNRTASASALNSEPGEGSLYEAWRWNHTDLLSLDPAFRPQRVLVIGLGHAYLIDALLDLPSIREIVIVELSQEVLDAVRAETKTQTARIFTDPRVHIVIGDGRRYVQKALAQGRHFDLIQNKVNEPWHAGASNLFTREFFQEEKNLLSDGGYLGVRPLLGHLQDGLAVFGTAIWPGYYHLYFPKAGWTLPEKAVITPDIVAAWERIIPNGLVGKRDPVLKIAYFTSMPPAYEVAANTDNRPSFEYTWVRENLGIWASPRQQLEQLDLTGYMHDLPVSYRK